MKRRGQRRTIWSGQKGPLETCFQSCRKEYFMGFEMGRNRQGLAAAWMLGTLVRTEEASELDQVGLGSEPMPAEQFTEEKLTVEDNRKFILFICLATPLSLLDLTVPQPGLNPGPWQ